MDIESQPHILQELSKVFTNIPFNLQLGLQVLSISNDGITLGFDTRPELIGNYLRGILHGGVISSVLDMAGGFAVMAMIAKRDMDTPLEELYLKVGKSSTVDLHIHYLRPGKGDRFTAKGWVDHTGNKVCFTRMELLNEKQELIATGTATYMIG